MVQFRLKWLKILEVGFEGTPNYDVHAWNLPSAKIDRLAVSTTDCAESYVQ